MPRLLPTMALEPPAGYITFVARHLDRLRDDAADALGDEQDGDRLYPDVLSDVAFRWSWLELRRTLFGQPGAADEYLRRAFARRSQRWIAEQTWEDSGEDAGDVQWHNGSGPRPLSARWAALEIQVWRPDAPPPLWTSSAVRLAPYLRPDLRPAARVTVGPVAEAAIAWWHAYETRRRRRVIAILIAVLLLVAVLLRVQSGEDPNASAELPLAYWISTS